MAHSHSTHARNRFPIETLIAALNGSMDEAVGALHHATVRQFPLLAARLRSSSKRQLRTLLLLDRRASQEDIRCALLALSHLGKPWLRYAHWQARVHPDHIPAIHGHRAAQLYRHLYRAILLGYAPLSLLPPLTVERRHLLDLHLSPSEEGRAALDTLADLRARIHAHQRHRPSPHVKSGHHPVLATTARGRNGWFEAT